MIVYLQLIDTAEDRSKFEQLYEQYKQLMFYTAFQILKRPQDAEDAVHHAFLSIAENISKISDPDCPKTRAYIVTIVERKAIDMLRDILLVKTFCLLIDRQIVPQQRTLLVHIYTFKIPPAKHAFCRLQLSE